MLLKDEGREVGVHKPTDGFFDSLDEEEKLFLLEFRDTMMALFNSKPEDSFIFLRDANLDVDETIALWSLLPSHVRSSYKKYTRRLK